MNIKHQAFLKANNLKKEILWQPIQEKIDIFERMLKLKGKVTPCEMDELENQLEILDLEILEDIETEYKDKLKNNELKEISIPKKKKELQKTDEDILAWLIKNGRTKVSKSKLRILGLKSPLSWNTTIGKYSLKRTSIFRFDYTISEI